MKLLPPSKVVLPVVGVVLFSLSIVAPSTYGDEPPEVSYPNLSLMDAEGGVNSPLTVTPATFTIGTGTFSGGVLTLAHRQSYVALRIPITGPLSYYNRISFKLRYPEAMPENFNFSVQFIDSLGAWAQTTFNKRANAYDEEWIEFEWDIVNQPDVNLGANLDLSGRIALKFTFSMIPENETRTIEVADIKLMTGSSVISGDPVLFQNWKNYVASYAPNYSNSAHHLLPPTHGRLSTPISIVENHLPLAEIVIGNTPSVIVSNAANELQHWIEKITGAELEILSTPSAASNVKIYLGSSFATGYTSDLTELSGTDGYAVRASGNNIYIFGALPKGTMNGVFAFLENNTDLIWLRPHPDYGTVYAEKEDLEILWADALDIPVGTTRGWLPNNGHGTSFALWSDRNRNNYVTGDPLRNVQWGNEVEVGGGHNLQTFIPQGNSLYYPTIGGVKPATLSIWLHQICMSVPGLAETYAANVLSYYNNTAPLGTSVVNIKIEDNWGVCECENCVAPIPLNGEETLEEGDPEFRSTQFYRFLNEVTERINDVYPNLQVQTYAYFYAAIPPLEELNPNIRILFCPYVRKDHRTPLFSPVNDHWWKMQDAWSESTDNVLIREYYGIFNEGRPLAEVVAADVQAKVDIGITGFGSEINQDQLALWWDGHVRGAGDEYDLNMMDYWIINRLYWNPDADVENLRKYFIRRTFREAAPSMERVFGMIRENWYKQLASSTWGAGNSIMNLAFGNSARLTLLEQHLSDARAATTHPTSLVLINRVAKRIENYLANVGAPPLPTTNGNNQITTTPEVIFNYGWPLPAYRTEIADGDENIPALRISFTRMGTSYPSIAARPMHSSISGIGYSFKLAGEIPSGLNASTLPALTVTDTNGKTEKSPASAYEQNAEGEWEFNWAPTGHNGVSVVNLSQINRLHFVFPGTGAATHDAVSFLLLNPTATMVEE